MLCETDKPKFDRLRKGENSLLVPNALKFCNTRSEYLACFQQLWWVPYYIGWHLLVWQLVSLSLRIFSWISLLISCLLFNNFFHYLHVLSLGLFQIYLFFSCFISLALNISLALKDVFTFILLFFFWVFSVMLLVSNISLFSQCACFHGSDIFEDIVIFKKLLNLLKFRPWFLHFK